MTLTRRLAAWLLLLASAPVHGQMPRIGVLGPDEPRLAELSAGLQTGLRQHGYTDAKLQLVERRVPRGDDAAARDAASSLVAQRTSVLFVVGSALARTARAASRDIPIVFITPGDPVAAGLVASLSRPGSNMTALTYEYPELSAKRLELLRELAPNAKRVLGIYDARDTSPRQGASAARSAAGALGLTFLERPVKSGDEVKHALKGLGDADAVLGVPGGITAAHFALMIAAANEKRLPSVFHARGADTREALLTYGASDVDIARQAARAIDKILKGADAGELPVERPTKLTLVLNARTAKAIGLVIPPAFALRADQIIE